MKYTANDFTWIKPSITNGQNLIAARTELGLSQSELANKVGVKVRQVQRLENGSSKPSDKSLKMLDEIFGLDWKTK